MRGLLLALALLLFALAPACAADRPRAVLLLVPGIDSERFFETLAQPGYHALRQHSGLALMNSSVPGPDTSASAFLTVGAGQRLPFPGKLDLHGESTPFGFRFGTGWVAAVQQAPGRTDAFPGALATLLRDAAISVGYVTYPYGGAPGPGLLSAMDSGGRVVMAPGSRWQSGPIPAGLTIVELTGSRSPEAALAAADLLASKLTPERDLLLALSPDPHPVVNGQWMRLSPVLAWGSPYAGSLLGSATTRTPGLLSNVDIASTLLAHFGVSQPARLEGHPARSEGPGGVGQILKAAAQARANRDAMVAGLIGWGVLALIAICTGLVALHRSPNPRVARTAQLLITAATSMPSSLLLAALIPTREPWQVLTVLAALTAILTLLSGISLQYGHSPLLAPYILLLVLLLADLYLPTRMLALNLMSDFTNVGGRFYGIGNEYLGLLLGVALIVPIWIRCGVGPSGVEHPGKGDQDGAEKEGSEGQRGGLEAKATGKSGTGTPGSTLPVAALWVAILIAVGAPSMGADFGGALSLALTFLFAWARLTGGRLTFRRMAGGLAATGAIGVLLVALDLSRPPSARTHLGNIISRLFAGESAAVLEMVARKAILNLEMARSPYFIAAMALIAMLFGFCYSRIGRQAGLALRRRPQAWMTIQSVLIGGVITMLLNDTGVIAWALAVGAALVWWLDMMLEDNGGYGSCAR